MTEGRQWSQWVRPPLARGDLDIRLTPGRAGRRALRIYRPTSVAARASAVANQALTALRMGRSVEPQVPDLASLLGLAGITADGAVTISISGRVVPRTTVGCATPDRLVAVVKIGTGDDQGLRAEAELLAQLDGGTESLRVPRLAWFGEWSGGLALATHGVERVRARPMSLDRAVDLAVALATEDLVHGDFAPWNVVPTAAGPVLVDWEHHRRGADPLFDLTHFALMSRAAAGDTDPNGLIDSLTDHGSPGWRYLDAIGIDPAQAPTLIRSYARKVSEFPSGDTLKFVYAVRRALSARFADPPGIQNRDDS